MFQNRSGQGGADGVMYRRAKLWQIIMVSTSAFIGMGFYSLIGLANYTASIGYGIATVAVGGILPLLVFLMQLPIRYLRSFMIKLILVSVRCVS